MEATERKRASEKEEENNNKPDHREAAGLGDVQRGPGSGRLFSQTLRRRFGDFIEGVRCV